jgi:hypothetical protein
MKITFQKIRFQIFRSQEELFSVHCFCVTKQRENVEKAVKATLLIPHRPSIHIMLRFSVTLLFKYVCAAFAWTLFSYPLFLNINLS